MLHQLAEADPAGVWAHRHSELRREQQNRHVLVDPGHPCHIQLQVGQGVGLQQLLEHDPVRRVLAAGDPDRGDRLRDGRMTEHVVRARRLLHPPRVEWRQFANPVDRGAHVPALVGVDRDANVRADLLAGDPHSPDVVREVRPDLQLQLPETLFDRLPAEPPQLLVGVTEPARCRGVRRIAAVPELRQARRSARLGPAQDLQRFTRGQGIAQVPEVDELDDLLRRQLCQQLPQRLSRPFGLQVPQRVDHGGDRHVHDALLRPQPAQLGVVHQLPPHAAEVVQGVLDGPTGHREL